MKVFVAGREREVHRVEPHETGENLRKIGVNFSLLDQERMTAQLVNRYLEVKARQLI